MLYKPIHGFSSSIPSANDIASPSRGGFFCWMNYHTKVVDLVSERQFVSVLAKNESKSALSD
jgi:hypothetical protein